MCARISFERALAEYKHLACPKPCKICRHSRAGDPQSGNCCVTRGCVAPSRQAKTPEFRARLAAGEMLDDLMPEAFAVVREASRRVLGMRHFDVQLVGAASCFPHTAPFLNTFNTSALSAHSASRETQNDGSLEFVNAPPHAAHHPRQTEARPTPSRTKASLFAASDLRVSVRPAPKAGRTPAGPPL